MSGPGVLVAAAVTVAAVACTTEVGDGSGPPPPQPAPERLVRAGAIAVDVVSEDLDADGVEEVAVSSVSGRPGELGIAIPYLEVFDVREARWIRVFDATGAAPPGAGSPAEMLAGADGFVGQSVQALEVVDFAGDVRPELVVGIASFGATAGPVELWIVSMTATGDLVTEFYRSTERGGEIAVVGDRIRLEYGVYRSRDPGCCPSLRAVETIGWDPAAGSIDVLTRRRTETR
jgi:hypothetical protein